MIDNIVVETLEQLRKKAKDQADYLERALREDPSVSDTQNFRREILPHVVEEIHAIEVALEHAYRGSHIITPAELQAEQRPWVLHNFGPGHPHQPLLGMVEELGELLDNVDSWNTKEIKDALADATIFCADYCTKRNWDFSKVYPAPENMGGGTIAASRDVDKSLRYAFRELARAAHHQLKSEQNIRGSKDKHEQEGAAAIRTVLVLLESMAAHFGWSLMEITTPVWAKVKKRDFKKNALTGGEGAVQKPTYYIASRLENAPTVRMVHAKMQARGWEPTYDWTVHGSVRGQGAARMAEVAAAEMAGVEKARVVVALLPGGKGTHNEFGAALFGRKPIIAHTTDPRLFSDSEETCAFYHHPLVCRVATIDEIPDAAHAALR